MSELLGFADALAVVDDAVAPRTLDTECLPVVQAHGRTLAADAQSRVNLPPFNKSAMDGYAVMTGDVRDLYQVIEEVPAGKHPTLPLRPGTATKVMTGAPVPDGAGRVVMVEFTEREGAAVSIHRHGGRTNICLRGEDVEVGDTVLRRGTLLDALALANVVACGVETVNVWRPVRLAVLITGDEIVTSFDELEPGKIIDTNGPLLAGLAAEYGLSVAVHERVPDIKDALRRSIDAAARQADIVLLTGGVSAGDYDFVPDCLTAAGFRIRFDRVAVKPGRPLTFATRKDTIALGLPGNPVSVYVGFHLVVRRIAALLMRAPLPPRAIRATLKSELKQKRADRTSFIPACLDDNGQVQPVDYHGSAHLLACRHADGLLEMPSGVDLMPAGCPATFYPLSLQPR